MSDDKQQTHPAIQNLESLQKILNDIRQKLNHQVVANCEVLEQIDIGELINFVRSQEAKTEKVDGRSDQDKLFYNIKTFRRQQVDSLIKGPVRQLLGRLSGLDKIIEDVKRSIPDARVAG